MAKTSFPLVVITAGSLGTWEREGYTELLREDGWGVIGFINVKDDGWLTAINESLPEGGRVGTIFFPEDGRALIDAVSLMIQENWNQEIFVDLTDRLLGDSESLSGGVQHLTVEPASFSDYPASSETPQEYSQMSPEEIPYSQFSQAVPMYQSPVVSEQPATSQYESIWSQILGPPAQPSPVQEYPPSPSYPPQTPYPVQPPSPSYPVQPQPVYPPSPSYPVQAQPVYPPSPSYPVQPNYPDQPYPPSSPSTDPFVRF